MTAQSDSRAGVALRPVTDLSDGRIIAYRAHPRPSAAGARSPEQIDAALAVAAVTSPAPLLVSVAPEVLLKPTFDPVLHARLAKCAPSEVVWMMPAPTAQALAQDHDPWPGQIAAAVRRHSGSLKAAGYRVGLEGVDPLTVAWDEMAAVRPSFLVVAGAFLESLGNEAERAGLVGLLAFSGHLGGRIIVEHVDEPGQADFLLGVGIHYGTGDHLHRPVVLDESLAEDADLVVRASWFRERAVRTLPGAQTDEPILYSPVAVRRDLADDRQLALLLTEWAGTLSNAHDPATVLEVLAEILPHVAEFDRLAIFEADWDRYLFLPRVLVGEELEGLMTETTPISTGITGWAFLRGAPYRCGQTIDHPEAAPIVGPPQEDESMLVIPMVSGGRRLGVLDLWMNGTDRFSQADLDRVTLVAKLGAHAWRSAMERDELAQRVVTDTATGLLNRRWWEELAPREEAQARRAETAIAVLLVDLDGFKAVNDSFGHSAGDTALKQVASALSSVVRSGDAVVRYGGDEFVLMLRDCDHDGAMEVAAQVRLALDRVQLPGALTLGASIGIAFFPTDGQTLDDVVGMADAAMYRAKARGGGQIAIFEPGDQAKAEVEAEGTPGVDEPADAHQAQDTSHLLRAVPRHELEDAIRRFRYAEQLSKLGSFEMDIPTGRVLWSEEFRRILGAGADVEPSVAALVDRIHPDDLIRYSDAVAEWSRAGWGNFSLRFGVVTPSGERREVHLRQVVRELGDGRRVLSGTIQELPASE